MKNGLIILGICTLGVVAARIFDFTEQSGLFGAIIVVGCYLSDKIDDKIDQLREEMRNDD